MTIPRNLSILAEGASSSGVLAATNGGTGATTLTGVLKGNGTSAFTAATAGTDYVAPGTATTFTATQTFWLRRDLRRIIITSFKWMEHR